MKHITLPHDEMNYPIGDNIIKNIPIIKSMSTLIDECYPTQKICLWCKGSSGSMISGIIASYLDKRDIIINHVKKDGEESHSNYFKKEKDRINIIVDDFIRTGATIISLMKYVSRENLVLDCLCVSGSVADQYTDASSCLSYDQCPVFSVKSKFNKLISSDYE